MLTLISTLPSVQQLYLLIAKFLGQGPCHNAADALLQDIAHTPSLLPSKYDWKGNKRPFTHQELNEAFLAIGSDRLPKLLSALRVHADAHIPPTVPGLNSLLSTGINSLLRTRGGTEKLKRQQETIARNSLHRVVFKTRGTSKHSRPSDYMRAKEIKGNKIANSRLPRFIPNLFEELLLLNGHRFPTFCVNFDRTNRRVITGSDDYLVKIWCADTGYLIYTLRGHAQVVSIMDISPDNSLLATASEDGIVRVWDLATSAPVAVLPTGLTARSRKAISSVSFSPSPIPQIRYLVATSLDGFTYIWKYDRTTKKFQQQPTCIDCKTFNDSKLKCLTWSSTGSRFAVAGTDLFIRVFSTIQSVLESWKARRRKSYDKIKVTTPGGEGSTAEPSTPTSTAVSLTNFQGDWGTPVLIAQLDGHVGVVTTLGFSHSGDRLMSGSVDGTVRIWRYDDSIKMWTSMSIDVRNEHTQADATINAAKPMMPTPPTISPTVVGQSSATDSGIDTNMNAPGDVGGNAETLPASQDVHDDAHEAPGASRTSNKPDDRITPVTAVWSLDDSAVILATSLAEIKVFDSVSGEWRLTLQGHSRGYNVFVVDVHPIDHRILLTAGYDGNIFLWDIEKGIQLRNWSFPGHEFLDGRFSPDGLMFAVSDEEGNCRLFGAGKNMDDYADARAFKEQTFWSDYAPVRYDADHNVVDDATQIAPHLMERTPILDLSGRDYQRQKALNYGTDMPTALAPGVLEQEENIKLEQLEDELGELTEENAALAIIPTTDKRKLYKRRREFIMEDDDDDDDPMTTEVPIVPLPNNYSSGEEYAEGGDASESSDESDANDSDGGQENGEAIPDRAFVVDDDDDEYNEYAGPSTPRRRRVASSNGTPKKQRGTTERKAPRRSRKRVKLSDENEDDFDDEDDDDDDGYESPRTPTRKRNSKITGGPSSSKSQRSARPKSFANDDYPSDENFERSDSDDDTMASSVHSGTSGSVYSGIKQPDFTSALPPKRKKQWRGNGRKKGKAVIRDEQAIELERWLPSDWIKVNEPRKTPYHPQLGDFVAYIRQGHEFFLRETPLRPRLSMKSVPFMRDPALPWVIFGRVSRITYDVGPPTWCTITLEEHTLNKSGGFPPHPDFAPCRRRFEIEFHDLEDVPDFIVLYSTFEQGMNAEYCIGEQVWATFDDNSYAGVISGQVVENKLFPDSMWMAFAVQWQINDTTNLSPWEMQREEIEDGNQGGGAFETIPIVELERVQEVLDHFIGMSEFQVFKEPVDFEAYPEYCHSVAYPICLDMINDRLMNNFYRRARAIEYDIKLLESNAITFNNPKSGIALMAKKLAREFKSLIGNPSRPLPDQFHVKAQANHSEEEDEEFDGEGSDGSAIEVDSEPDVEAVVSDEFDQDDEDDDDFATSSRSRRGKGSSGGRNGRNGSTGVAHSSRSNGRNGTASSTTPTGASSSATKRNGTRRSLRRGRGDDDDDGDFGGGGDEHDEDHQNGYSDHSIPLSPTTRTSANSSSTRRAAARQQHHQQQSVMPVKTSQRRNHSQQDDDDEDENEYNDDHGQDDDDDDFAGTVTSPSRPMRQKRKKVKIVSSDDDYQ